MTVFTCTAMFDLATDSTSNKLINEFYTHNKVVAAVCHGPAALTHVKLSTGGYLLDGQPVTGFSNSEEDAVGLTAAMPFSLEDKLNEASGGKFVKADEDWGPKVVVARDGRLITGQNPASATGVGQAIYDAIFGQLTTRDEI
jgi:putative intracellular protease/amidase